MRSAACAMLLLVLGSAGCGRQEAVPVQASTARTEGEPPKTPGTIALPLSAQREAGIVVERAEEQPVAAVISAPGQFALDENRTWMVGAITDGRLMRVFVNLGDPVKAGQVLARMHSHDIHEAQAAYRVAVAELRRNESLLNYAQRARDRATRLLELRAASREQVDLAEAELQNAQTRVANARTTVDKEKVHLTEFLEVPVPDTETAEHAHDEAEEMIPVKSPADGVVVQRQANVGMVANAGDALFTVASLSQLWMVASVNEADLQHVRVGQRVRVLTRAFPDGPFTGRVERLGEKLDATTRTLQVRIAVPNQQGGLRPEMFATAEIELPGSRRALFVPEAALQDVNGQRVVFVRVAADRFEARPIEPGRVEAGRREVVRGIQAGEEVVVKGGLLLKGQLLKSSLEEE